MDRTRLLFASIASLCLASSASHAVIYTFDVTDTGEFTFLDIGPLTEPFAVQGNVVISDTGNGTPTLLSMVLDVKWDEVLSGAEIDAITGVPGSTVEIDFETTISPTPAQTGNGNVNSPPVNWGPITGWSQTGTLFCQTTCPTTCATFACQDAFGFEGTGPPPPLTSTTYTLDPWDFSITPPVASFTSTVAGQTFWLIPGSVKFQGHLFISGVRTVVPALGAWGASALAGALLFAGYWSISRRRS
jgi:hypothetical protein